jgi:hypothetical protein
MLKKRIDGRISSIVEVRVLIKEEVELSHDVVGLVKLDEVVLEGEKVDLEVENDHLVEVTIIHGQEVRQGQRIVRHVTAEDNHVLSHKHGAKLLVREAHPKHDEAT